MGCGSGWGCHGVGWECGKKGKVRRKKNMLFGWPRGTRSLFQRHSQEGATVRLCNAFEVRDDAG